MTDRARELPEPTNGYHLEHGEERYERGPASVKNEWWELYECGGRYLCTFRDPDDAERVMRQLASLTPPEGDTLSGEVVEKLREGDLEWLKREVEWCRRHEHVAEAQRYERIVATLQSRPTVSEGVVGNAVREVLRFVQHLPACKLRVRMGENCSCGRAEAMAGLLAALQSRVSPQADDLMTEHRKTLQIVEFRLALSRITEHYSPDTVAGRLAADALAKYPRPYENADRENDDEPFEVEEIKGLPLSPQAGMREALEEICAETGDRGDGFIDWQRCVDRIQQRARAALATAPIPMSEAERISLENGGDPC